MMTTELSFWHLISQASFLVQVVMLILVILSLVSWTHIFQRGRVLKTARREHIAFEDAFWSGGDLNQLYQSMTTGKKVKATQGCARIFCAGLQEFSRMRKLGAEAAAVMDGAERAMRVAVTREADRLQMNLPFLATVGSASPYIGLFGTVWGIMGSFRALGSVQQATLSMVAPGIAEALIATAMGLFAAIPAVIFYNRYSAEATRLITDYENFQEEFTSIIQRRVYTTPVAPTVGEPGAAPTDTDFNQQDDNILPEEG